MRGESVLAEGLQVRAVQGPEVPPQNGKAWTREAGLSGLLSALRPFWSLPLSAVRPRATSCVSAAAAYAAGCVLSLRGGRGLSPKGMRGLRLRECRGGRPGDVLRAEGGCGLPGADGAKLAAALPFWAGKGGLPSSALPEGSGRGLVCPAAVPPAAANTLRERPLPLPLPCLLGGRLGALLPSGLALTRPWPATDRCRSWLELRGMGPGTGPAACCSCASSAYTGANSGGQGTRPPSISLDVASGPYSARLSCASCWNEPAAGQGRGHGHVRISAASRACIAGRDPWCACLGRCASAPHCAALQNKERRPARPSRL